MGMRLYVGRLADSVTDSTLQALFGEFGLVRSAQVTMNLYTGHSQGFGFVEMGTQAEAQAAIVGLHRKMVEGRRLSVSET